MRSIFRCVLVGIALAPLPLCAQEDGLPRDLGFVRPDGLGFVHVRVGDIWKSEHFKEWRQTVLKAGKQVLDAFDRRFFPAPSSVDRVTIFVAAPGKDQGDADRPMPLVQPFVIIATSRAVDQVEFLKHTVPGAEEIKTDAGTFLIDRKKDMETHFLDERTFVVGPAGAVQALLAKPRAADGNLSAGVKLAQSGKALVAAVSTQGLPPMALQQVPPPFRPMLKAKLATLTLDLKKESRIDVRLVYPGADEAAEAETAANQGIQMARGLLAKGRVELRKKAIGDGKPASLDELPEAAAAVFGLGMLNRLDEFLGSSPLKKEDDALHLSVKLPQGGAAVFSMAAVGSALLVPAVQKVREAAGRTQSSNNLKQIALAMHIYHDANKRFPAAAICDADGKPLLSWRVAILPYIEQMPLYRQFKLDEPWDSEHNRKLIPMMPVTYALPAAPLRPGQTHYRVFVGGGAGFDLCQGMRIADMRDGTSNTILAVEAAQSVPWTKPDELVYDAKKPLPRLGDFYGSGLFMAAFYDGSVRALRVNMPQQTLRAYITRAGSEVIPID